MTPKEAVTPNVIPRSFCWCVRPIKSVLLSGWLLLIGQPAAAAEWPQFRGPERNGISGEAGLATNWPSAGPPRIFQQTIGAGFAGIAVVGGRLYTQAASGETEYALALDARTGEELWRYPVGETFHDEFGDGPRSTPTVDRDLVYALSSKGQLHALAAATGEKLWTVDLPATFGAQVPRWGYATSPLVEGELVFAEAGGEGRAVVALERTTGALRWATENGGASYSSPIAFTAAGERQVIFLRRAGAAGPEVVAFQPQTGQLRWRHPALPATIAIPLFVPPDRLLITSGDDAGALLLALAPGEGGPKVQPVWQERTLRSYVNGVVYLDGWIYGFDNATLRCVAAADGRLGWAQRGFGKGSLIAASGTLIVLGDRGEVALVAATPDAYHEQARFQALVGKTWTAPSLANGILYLRDQDEITGFDLRTTAAPKPAP